MPYASVKDAVKRHPNLKKYSAKAKRAFVHAFNASAERGKEDDYNFAVAYSAANKVDGIDSRRVEEMADAVLEDYIPSEVAVRMLSEDFDPDQPRDETGKWTGESKVRKEAREAAEWASKVKFETSEKRGRAIRDSYQDLPDDVKEEVSEKEYVEMVREESDKLSEKTEESKESSRKAVNKLLDSLHGEYPDMDTQADDSPKDKRYSHGVTVSRGGKYITVLTGPKNDLDDREYHATEAVSNLTPVERRKTTAFKNAESLGRYLDRELPEKKTISMGGIVGHDKGVIVPARHSKKL